MEANVPTARIEQMYNQRVSSGIEQECAHLDLVPLVVVPKGEVKGEGDRDSLQEERT
jgi:hypothetical protein